MPKATMNKHGYAPPDECDVGPTRERLDVDSVAKAARIQSPPEDHLRLRILRLDPSHVLGSANCSYFCQIYTDPFSIKLRDPAGIPRLGSKDDERTRNVRRLNVRTQIT